MRRRPHAPAEVPSPRALVLEPDGRWLELLPPIVRLEAASPAQVPALLVDVERRSERGEVAIGWVSYEAAPAFDPALTAGVGSPPYAVFLVSRRWQRRAERGLGLRGRRLAIEWRPEIDAAAHRAALEQILAGIAAGDFYQVNHTFRVLATVADALEDSSASPGFDPWPLFANLQRAQRGAFAAYVDDGTIAACSASPELFFALDGERIESRPMKGTARRGLDLAEDGVRIARLRTSSKERAENLMIVDMVRNDLGRIALPGSVEARDLFVVETYPTVHQMVSTVSARTRAPMVEIFRALFPAASITGAPKSSSMRAIAAFEPSPRGIYTGAVGAILPGRRARFAVAIRTAVLDRGPEMADRRLVYGTGSGVVADSDPASEWRECAAKAANLRHVLPRFRLLESLRWSPARGYWYREAHLERMAASALYFGFRWRESAVRRRLDATAAELSVAGADAKVRLLVDRRGSVEVTHEPLGGAGRWRVALGGLPVHSRDRFLRHKTTRRGVYRSALGEARRRHPEADDVLLFNQQGELTETTRANVVVLDEHGRWSTPEVGCGLLDGVLRRRLLGRGRIVERVISRRDLLAARDVLLINSVRGLVRIDPVGWSWADVEGRRGA